MAIEQIGSETVKALKEALTPLAEKLGTTAEATWPIVIAQQKVDAITESIFAFFTLIGTSVAFRWMLWAAERNMQEDMNVQAIVAGALTLFGSIAIVMCITTIVEKILNPEFQALDYFLSLVKNTVSKE